MTTISLTLPRNLLLRLERESRARRTTKSLVVRECLEQQLPDKPPPLGCPSCPRVSRFTTRCCRFSRRHGRAADAGGG